MPTLKKKNKFQSQQSQQGRIMVTIGQHTCQIIWELNPVPCNAADTLFDTKGFNSHVNLKITDICCQIHHTDSKLK